MKSQMALLLLAFVKVQGPHASNVRDLVMMERVSDPPLWLVPAYRTGGITADVGPVDRLENLRVGNAVVVANAEREQSCHQQQEPPLPAFAPGRFSRGHTLLVGFHLSAQHARRAQTGRISA